jgi:hypothetical protein
MNDQKSRIPSFSPSLHVTLISKLWIDVSEFDSVEYYYKLHRYQRLLGKIVRVEKQSPSRLVNTLLDRENGDVETMKRMDI